MHFQATYTTATKTSKFNLDNLQELQEVSNKMQGRGFTKATISAFDCEGLKSTGLFMFNDCSGWTKIEETFKRA